MSGPIFGLFRNIYRFYFGLSVLHDPNSTTSTLAEANLDFTRSSFIRSRQRSTTYRLKRSRDVFFPCDYMYQVRGFEPNISFGKPTLSFETQITPFGSYSGHLSGYRKQFGISSWLLKGWNYLEVSSFYNLNVTKAQIE